MCNNPSWLIKNLYCLMLYLFSHVLVVESIISDLNECGRDRHRKKKKMRIVIIMEAAVFANKK
jgi:hypothetical protein